MNNFHLGVNQTMLCSGVDCAKTAPGHALRPLQFRVAAATPGKWRDAVVSSASGDGWIGIVLVESGNTVWLWNHGDLTNEVEAGTPVALHALYDTLAIGAQRVNVLVAPSVTGISEV
jgi:hypothetical protein